MIKHKDDFSIDLSTSCSKEDAVARLLGCLNGPVVSKNDLFSQIKINSKLIKNSHPDEESLSVVFSNLRKRIIQDIKKPAKRKEPLLETIELLGKVDNLIKQFHTYLLDIDEELAQGPSSELVLDPNKKDHITLKSLNKWALRKYNITILME